MTDVTVETSVSQVEIATGSTVLIETCPTSQVLIESSCGDSLLIQPVKQEILIETSPTVLIETTDGSIVSVEATETIITGGGGSEYQSEGHGFYHECPVTYGSWMHNNDTDWVAQRVDMTDGTPEFANASGTGVNPKTKQEFEALTWIVES